MTNIIAALIFDGSEVGPPEHLMWSHGAPSQVTEAMQSTPGPIDTVLEMVGEDGQPATLWLRREPSKPGANVLVVEDDPLNLAFYVDVVERLGLVPYQAKSGAEARDHIARQPMDLALIDIRLPDVNGFEFSREVAMLESQQDCALLLMSADADLADQTSVAEAGASGFIVNPVSVAELGQRISDALVPAIAASGVQAPSRDDDIATTASLGLRFFGRPAIVVADQVVPLRSGRSTDLLAMLAGACPASVSPERLARFGWQQNANASQNAVYTAMSRLRSFLDGVGAADLVVTDGTGYFLNLDPQDVDLIQFERLADEALGDSVPQSEKLQLALDAWVTKPFEGTKNELLIRWSRRLSETRSRLLEAFTLDQITAGKPDAAAEICRELLYEEPWRELTWAVLIIALYRAGRTRDALEAATEARTSLLEDLGLAPGPILANLELLALTHDPILAGPDWQTILTASEGA